MTPNQRRFDRMVGLFALAALVVGMLLVLRPFVSSVLWAIVLTYSTWPVFEAIRRVLRGNSTYAASAMTGLLTLVVVLPVTILGVSLGDSVAPVIEAIRGWLEGGPPDPPPWVAQLPLIGESVEAYWAGLAHNSVKLGEEIRRLVDSCSPSFSTATATQPPRPTPGHSNASPDRARQDSPRWRGARSAVSSMEFSAPPSRREYSQRSGCGSRVFPGRCYGAC
jgi:predicted PurR-regulated permease PerM